MTNMFNNKKNGIILRDFVPKKINEWRMAYN